tara:strand:- start:219 stop:437 length:219 start_codon:yes stop_codon:yes gene_type:complete
MDNKSKLKFKVGDLIELACEDFVSLDKHDYPAGMLGIVVDSVISGNGEPILWVHFSTGYVGALYAKRVRKAA